MKITLSVIAALSLVAAGSATVVGTSNNSSTCFTGASGNLPNIRLTNSNLVVNWGWKGDCINFTPTSYATGLNTPFKAGTMCWYNNGSRYEPGGYLNTTLQVGLKFSSPAGVGTKVFSFNLNVNQGAGLNQDTMTIGGTPASQVFTVGNTQYTLKVLGFKPQGAGAGASNVTTWQTPEGSTKCLDLWTELDAQPVPEPASLAVLGLGAAALIRRRRSK